MGIGQPNGAILKPLVSLGELPDDCWNWLGAINKNTGYGKKTWFGKDLLAHRWVYEMLLGKIPDDLVINHKCRNRRCVNPHHLEITTQAKNCRHGNGAKLTFDQVLEIMEAKNSKQWGDGARLARKYNVSGALIHDIWNGRAWRELSK